MGLDCFSNVSDMLPPLDFGTLPRNFPPAMPIIMVEVVMSERIHDVPFKVMCDAAVRDENGGAVARARIMAAEAKRARGREDALEALVRRLLKAREDGMNLSDMQAMAQESGIDV